MTRPAVRPFIGLCAAVLSAAACGSSTTPVAPPPTIASVRFSASDTIFLKEGDTVRLAPRAYDAAGHEVSATFSFAIAPGGTAAAVDGHGVVTATGPGVAVAVATAGAASASLPVAVFGHPSDVNTRGVTLGGRPYGLAVTADGSVFVTQLDARSVTRMALPALNVTATISVGQTPTGISANRAGTLLAVANQFDPSVGLINAASNAQVATLTAPATTFRTIFGAGGAQAYATSSDGHLVVVNVAGQTIAGTVGIPLAANGLALGPDSSRLYVSSMNGAIGVVDVSSGQTVASVTDTRIWQDLAVAADGSTLFVADESNSSVDMFALPSLTPAGSIALAYGAFGLALSPDGARLYVTQPTGHRVTVIDPRTKAVVQNVDLSPATSTPRRVAFDRFGGTAVVTDEAGAVWALGANAGPAPAIAAAVRFENADTLFLQQGQATQLVAEAVDADGQVMNTPITYEIADGTSTTVTGHGALDAVGPGVSTVRATAGTATATRVIGVYGHPGTTTQSSQAMAGRPYGLAVGAGGTAFVTQLDSRTVTDFSLQPLAVTRSIPVGFTPTGLSIDARSTSLLVANQGDPSIGLIDLATDAQVLTIATSANTFRTIFSPDDTMGYATVADGHLVAVNLATRTPAGIIGIPRSCNGIAWGPVASQLILSCADTLAAVDVTTGQRLAATGGWGSLQDVALAPDGRSIFVANEAHSTVDVAAWPSLARSATIALDGPAFGLAMTPDGTRLFATEPDLGIVAIIDPATRAVTGRITLATPGARPRRVAFDRFGTIAVVSDESGRVSVIR